MSRKRKTSHVRSIGVRAFEQLAAVGLVFMLSPYLKAQLEPLREKAYGPVPPGTPPENYVPNVQSGTVPLPDVSNPTGASPTTMAPVSGNTPANLLNITPPLAPTGDTPAPIGGPALAPNAGPLGGLFLGS